MIHHRCNCNATGSFVHLSLGPYMHQNRIVDDSDSTSTRSVTQISFSIVWKQNSVPSVLLAPFYWDHWDAHASSPKSRTVAPESQLLNLLVQALPLWAFPWMAQSDSSHVEQLLSCHLLVYVSSKHLPSAMVLSIGFHHVFVIQISNTCNANHCLVVANRDEVIRVLERPSW